MTLRAFLGMLFTKILCTLRNVNQTYPLTYSRENGDTHLLSKHYSQFFS